MSRYWQERNNVKKYYWVFNVLTIDMDDNLSDEEMEALHEMQLGKEDIRKAYGQLVQFHHNIGSGMNHFKKAADKLEEADMKNESDEVGEIVPKDVIEGYWTWKLIEEFEEDFFQDVMSTESDVREKLSDGEEHVNEQLMEKRRKENYFD